MASYSKIFGSQFPDNIITLSEYKDIGEATNAVKELITQYYAYMEAKDYASASTLLENNWDVLKQFYIGMDVLNKIEEEIYNTQLYAIKNSDTVIADTEPNASEYTHLATWLKPV